MIKWRLKRQGADDKVVSFEILKLGSGWTSIMKKSDKFEWGKIFDTVSPTKVVTIGGVKFLSGSLLEPEVYEEKDGSFLYYITHDEVKIDEIPLQISDIELEIYILNRGKNKKVFIFSNLFLNR